MILALAAKGKKTIACTMLVLMYFEMVIPPFASAASMRSSGRTERIVHQPDLVKKGVELYAEKPAPVKSAVTTKVLSPRKVEGGPTQPEMQEFHSVGDENMVDLFTGDFSYSIPLMDVGGYPIAIGYNSGITMDQEASWTGLGWNINPGTITRNMRGLPDEFNGQDSVMKESSMKENSTVGVSTGFDMEILGLAKWGKSGATDSSSLSLSLNASMGIFRNSYRGIGIEYGAGAGIRSAKSGGTGASLGLGFGNNSQEGLTISPSASLRFAKAESSENAFGGSLSVSAGYNTRSGLKALQSSAGISAGKKANKNLAHAWAKGMIRNASRASVGISFAYPSFNPSMSIPFTNKMTTITFKVGAEYTTVHPNWFISGYSTKQWIADEDKKMYFPAYGYLNFQNASGNASALLDYNREKDIVYREKPALPNIAVPGYTYDIFSISGEGISGAFRAYRSDIGYVHDHRLKTRDKSDNISGDVGFGNIGHVGVDYAYTRSYTEVGPWTSSNPMAATVAFTKPNLNYEAAYFRNPGEKTVNTRSFYDAIGGDDVVYPKLLQSGNNSSDIRTANILTRFKDGNVVGEIPVTKETVIKKERDKRTQVISYLTAKEANVAAQSKYIENHRLNKYIVQSCATVAVGETDKDSTGLWGEYYNGRKFDKLIYRRRDTALFLSQRSDFYNGTTGLANDFTVRWTGRIKAPVTGTYKMTADYDDGVRIFINDSAFIADWKVPATSNSTVNLEEGVFYNFKVEYLNNTGAARLKFYMHSNGDTIKPKDFFLPAVVRDTFEVVRDTLYKEQRVTSTRKANHISQIEVLNEDGKRYVYGIPVYNLKQKETTFAVNHNNGNAEDGTVSYNHGTDNTVDNPNGNDFFYTSEEIPAYPHSFLLTSILTPDYVDITGNGISDDDAGNAVKLNYTKIAGAANPYKWRTPYSNNATYNEGLKTDNRDDRGSYVYGEKELWYLNAIESKNMIATFVLGDRKDLQPINEKGEKLSSNLAKKLVAINLYTKADFIKRNVAATPVKTVHFEYTYDLCKGYNTSGADSSGKLTLKRIYFTYNGNKKSKKNAYVFYYNGKNPSYDHKSFDRWGNYKDPAQNPKDGNNIITNADYPYALQDSTLAAANAAAWTLDSIVLPSGGRMKITYESDDYAYVQHHRAAQMFNVAGFSYKKPESMSNLSDRLYEDDGDNLYVAVKVPDPVTSKEEVYNKYLRGLDSTMYFRMNVKMPGDKWGSGFEYIPSYAKLVAGEYGLINSNTIWFKVGSIDKKGETGGSYSPMAKSAAQFLRLNLPSKAYPGSDVGDELNLANAVKLLSSLSDNIVSALKSFDGSVRSKKWVKYVNLSRSLVRLNSPGYKKYGDGLRVKKIVIYDHWNEMTKQKESVYGSEYEYTTIKEISGKPTLISSGVAAYEPILGAEENPLRLPIEYGQQAAAWAPVDMGYAESPMGESFYPAPTVGYSVVRKRSIHNKKIRSKIGYEENCFYTAYDFPTISEFSLLNPESKRSYKPLLNNLLKIDAKHHLVMSQGFKVELNDMHGRMKSQKSYAETDSSNAPSSSIIHYYHVDDQHAEIKHLNNTVLVMGADGVINGDAIIGKDMELMMDMRQNYFSSNSLSAQANVDVFTWAIPPVLGLPMFWAIPQSEENIFRSSAAMKVINRHGILDSVEVIDKGSKVMTHNLLYDGETGEVILTATQNEFGDSIFNFNYPAGWMYEGMSGAYKNINAVMEHVNIRAGKITNNTISAAVINSCFYSGDEILTYGKNKVNDNDCAPVAATFPNSGKIWAVDANALKGGTPDIYFMDEEGAPYSGNDVSMKVIRSGRKNISASVGTVTMMKNPLVKTGNSYQLVINKQSKIINASMVEYKQNWQVQDRKKQKIICAY